jgi:ribosomal protein S18 acetylase RimI-like enzyme
MNYTIRPATKADTSFLWQMLYYAAHMDEDSADPESARTNPDLAGYVESWTERQGDAGVIAVAQDGRPAGAAWVRVMAESPLYRVVAPGTPELAIAMAPEHLGGGAGTLLLLHLLEAVRGTHRAVALSVRADNPAKRLYERSGFVTVASITNRVGTTSYVMRAELS